MTNRHVAEIFTTGLGQRGLQFRPGQVAGLDFRREVMPAEPIYVDVVDIAMVHPHWDMALLRVEGLPERQRALRLSVTHPDDLVDRDIVVVGYPAQDWRNDLDLQNRIFRGIFNVKRMQPGKVRARGEIESYGHLINAMTHDGSTLGGNSGSAVVDVATGDVIGLHFAGLYLKANYGVPTYELARDARVVDAGVRFAGSLEPTDAWVKDWLQAESDREATRSVAPVSHVSAGTDTQSTTSRDSYQTVTWIIPLQVSVTLGLPRRGDGGSALMVTSPTEAPPLRVEPDPNYQQRRGYNSRFLSEEFEIPLPWLPIDQYKKVAFNRWAREERHVLPYHHFSIVMNRERRLAYFTAVNIDGRQEKDMSRDDFKDAWFVDPRIGANEQLQNDLYLRNPFDRGHLVRRLDPVWGRRFLEAKKAHDDTFHWTNCSPQHKRFNRNRSTWGLVENWILENAHTKNQRVTVFTGPVFRDNDPVFTTESGDRVQIPLQYWKVVAMVKQDGELSATAYLVAQEKLIDNLVEAVREPKSFQKTVREIEQLTGLSFNQLRDHDPLTRGAEEAPRPREIELLSMHDIVL